ncbi:MAG: T9SS C-terminal target domain-containing protein [Bacteroidetes bacterium]|nr:MAG: T9SS C-terminal target domain-containing protein [Bacteroidota bacterium]
MKKIYTMLLGLLFFATTNAQITRVNEDFDVSLTPTGWTNSLNTGTLIARVATIQSYGRVGTAASVRANFFNVGAGSVARLETPVFSPTVAGDTLRFDVAHAAYPSATDSLVIYTFDGVSFNRLIGWGSSQTINTTTGITTANSQTGGFTPTSGQWTTKALSLPVGTTQVRFEFISGYGNQMYVDRVIVDSFYIAGMNYVSSTTTQSNTASVFRGTSNTEIIGITVNMSGTVSPLSATSFSLNTGATTNATNSIDSAKIFYTGNSNVFATTNRFGQVVSPNGAFTISGNQTLNDGANFFWLVYDVKPTATVNNILDAECSSIEIGGTPRTPTVQNPTGSRTILGATEVDVTSTSGLASATYSGLKAAFDAINLGTHQGAINIRINSSVTEPVTCNLDSSGNPTGSNYTSILIRPADTATVVKSISMSAAAILMTLTGADNVTFDGRPGGVGTARLLEFNHTTSAATNFTCRLNVGATNNTFQFCRLLNASAASTAHNIHLTNTVASSPNSNNQFLNNAIIGGRNGIVFDAINASGPMVDIVVRNNQISNFGFAGVSNLNNLGQIVIDSNSFFHDVAFTATGQARAISLGGTLTAVSMNATITKNRIFGIKSSTTSIFGIILTPPATATGSLYNINNNSIAFMDANNAVNGGAIGGVNGITVTGTGSAEFNIFQNTIRIGGVAVGGTAATLTTRSVGVGKFNSGTANIFRMRNNIITNTRTGGASTQNGHMAVWINTNTAGTHDIDRNTYQGTTFVAGWGGTVFATVTGGYQTAATPNDANTNQKTPTYLNTTEPYLTGASNGDADLSTTRTATVLTDIDNNARPVTCYKGAWESTTPFITNDLAATIIYTYGRIPVGTDESIRVRIKNNAITPAVNQTITVNITGANTATLTLLVPNISALADTIITMPIYTPVFLGIDTVRAVMPSGDQNPANDIATWIRENTLNAISYANITTGQTGNVGNNGFGEIVAKFYTPFANAVNQVNVNFTNVNPVVPRPFQVVIYADSGANFGPRITPIWESTVQQTLNGIFNLAVPAVAVNGNFFIGVRQTSSDNIGFAFQAENPIRPNTMYFRQAPGSLAAALLAPWVDFAPNNGFRFMIEPRLQINDDLGATELVNPAVGCLSTGTQNIAVEVTNLGLLNQNFATDSLVIQGRITDPANVITNLGPITINSGTLNSNATANYILANNFNFNQTGNYTITAWTRFGLDNNKVNDTLLNVVRTVTAATPVPLVQGFNAGLAAPSGVGATNGLRVNINGLSGFNANASVQTSRITGVNTNSILRFNYRVLNNLGGTAATFNNATDSIRIQISTNCGVSFNTIATISSANHTPSVNYGSFSTSLAAFNGSDVVVKILCNWLGTTNDVIIDIDDIRLIDGANDMGAVASSAPCRSVIVGSAAIAPQVTIRNFGSSAQTNVPVNVSITGPVNYTGTATIASIAAASDASVLLTTNFNPTTAGLYTLKAWTSLVGDGDASNDTFTTTFNVTNLNLGVASVNALNFGGTSSLRVTETPALNPLNEFTLEAWLNRITTGTARSIIAKDSALGFIQYELGLTQGDSLRFTVNTSTGFYQITSTTVVPNGFAHVAATFSSTSIKLYINGRLVRDSAIAASIVLPFGSNVFIGNNNQSTSALLGQLDEVRIWNVERSANQIRGSMHTRLANAANASLVAYYRFDEGTGNTFATDASGNCHTGVFGAAAPTWVAVNYPLGAPTVASQTVNTDGTYTFAGTNLSLVYNGFAGADTVYVHQFAAPQLGVSPITNPGGSTTLHPAYWLAYRYGSGTSTSTNFSFNFPTGNLNSGVSATDLKLYNRANTSLNAWSIVNATASSVDFATQNVTFAQTQAIFGGQFMVGANNNPLPVVMRSFTGSANRGDAILRWSTASEYNSRGFSLERSFDGRIFKEVTFINSAGNSNRTNSYSYADREVLVSNKTVYYRLKQVDLSGEYTYTNVVIVNSGNRNTTEVVIYPNPVLDVLSVEVESNIEANAKMVITDITGKVVKNLDMRLVEGFNKFSFGEVVELTNGVYIVNITANGVVLYNTKLVKAQ